MPPEFHSGINIWAGVPAITRLRRSATVLGRARRAKRERASDKWQLVQPIHDSLRRIGGNSWNRRVVPDQLWKFGLHAAMHLERTIPSFGDERLHGIEGTGQQHNAPPSNAAVTLGDPLPKSDDQDHRIKAQFMDHGNDLALIYTIHQQDHLWVKFL